MPQPFNYDTTTLNALSAINFGIRVDRATAALPQSATGTIFNIVGGRVLLKLLVGEVTTIIQAQATTLKVTSTPTVGTAVDLCATADLNALEVGGKVSVIGVFATALNKTNAGAVQGMSTAPIVLAVGTLGIVTVASSTGSMKWSLWYVPLDDGAYVTAA
jgi:hypothetical protein